MGAATYLVDHPTFGMLSFGGNVGSDGTTVIVKPRDAVRKRIFIAPVSLYVTVDAGVIDQFTYDSESNSVEVRLVTDDAGAAVATMKWEQVNAAGAAKKLALSTTGLKSRLDGLGVDLPATLNFTAA